MTVPISESQKLTPSAELMFFVLDATVCGGGVTYIATEPNELGVGPTWQGQQYTVLPIQADGFEITSKGTLPRPKLRVAALDGFIGGLVRDYEDLVGATVTVKHFYARHLDAVNFAAGNPYADPNTHWADESYVISRKTLEDNVAGVIEFETISPMDQPNAMIPPLRIGADICAWNDASICTYSVGGACGHRLSDCKTKWGATADLPFGAFVGTSRIR